MELPAIIQIEMVVFQKPPILTSLYFLSTACLESPVRIATERWNLVTEILTVYSLFVFCFFRLCLWLWKYDALKYRTHFAATVLTGRLILTILTKPFTPILFVIILIAAFNV